jgi:ribosomal protein L16/L10AE
MATAKKALALADGKLPLKTRFTVRRDFVEQVEKK